MHSTAAARRPSPTVDARPPVPFLERILGSFGKWDTVRFPAAAREVRRTLSLCHVLLSERGEVSGISWAAELVAAYRSLDAPVRDLLFDRLASDFAADRKRIQQAIDAYSADPSETNLIQLQGAIEPPRQELFRRINMAPGGIGVLLDMRRHILGTLPEQPHRAGINADLVHLFRSWFSRGFLVLKRIDWRTSALVLERLIHYEAVHQIQGWRDLHRRMEADRRCYAFFHPVLPDEPLIFIEVVLARGMSANVQPLLDPDSAVLDPAVANCAIFYSITNCQEGLQGVTLGNLLIKQVADDLGKEFPRLRTFATLSPIPGFRKWLATVVDTAQADISAEVMALVEKPDTVTEKHVSPNVREDLRRLCAYYLLHAKQDTAPLDPVARFHLANGARLERLNWLGDTSESGLRRSLGLMVNYVYRLADVEGNHEAYARDCTVIASYELKRLARQAPLFRPNGTQG